MHSKEIDVSEFWCWNKECSDYGVKGNIVQKERYGKDNILLLKCKTCGHCFSENRGTVFFQLKTPRKEVLRTLALFTEKGSIRGLARATGHDKNVILNWLDVAGKHCKEVNEFFLHDLELDKVQVDEIWSYIKKEKNVTPSDPEEYGTVYTSTSMKTDTWVFLSHVEGTRTIEDYTVLFSDVERKRSFDSPIPVFTSDNWDPLKEALVTVYGVVEHPPYKGIGRKPYHMLVPHSDLKYAQGCKKRENGRIVEVVQRIVFGDPEEVLKALGADVDGKVNTSYAERLNLTFRNSLALFIRKTMNISKNIGMHSRAIDFFQAWYNFVKPHKSLRLLVMDRKRKWKKRTPMMAEELTDHVWTLEELFTFKIPVQ